MKNTLKIFDENKIRIKWDNNIKDYYYSIIDVICVLTDCENPEEYLIELKRKLSDESCQSWDKLAKVNFKSDDGTFEKSEAVTTKELLRIIQSISSSKAELFKDWLVQIAEEGLKEIANPELALKRAINTYRKKGYSEKWIDQRLLSIEIRKDLTSEWNRAGVKEKKQQDILNDDISKAWSGMSTEEYKQYKNIKKESLKDNMTNMELILNMLAEVSTTEISKAENPVGLNDCRDVAKRGGNIAANTRRELESVLGREVITKKNSKTLKLNEGS